MFSPFIPGILCTILYTGVLALNTNNMDTLTLKKALAELTDQLLYSSESDYPFEVVASGDLDGELTGAKHLDAGPPALDQACAPQHLLVDHAARLELVQVAQVDDGVLDPVGRVEAELRQPALQRRLTAFEAFEPHVA